MTDRIDLDELTDTADEATPEDRPNRGDWLWREAGDPDDEPVAAGAADANGGDGTEEAPGPGGAAAAEEVGGAGDPANEDSTASRLDRAVPHVPRANKDKPVGIPIEGGGAGGGRARGDASSGSVASGGEAEGADGAEAEGEDGAEVEGDAGAQASAAPAASGPHGGDADDMTMALTYGAAKCLANPARVFADAAGWADWVGIVGDVDAPVINKFQRDNGVDVDFFNGSGTGPGERLAEVGPRSMFFAERMVVVGLAGRDEGIAGAADWEFVPLETAAAKAGWELTEQATGRESSG